MRKLYSVFIAVIITASVFAQAPEKMSYQAVVRNSTNQLVVNQAVGMRISILQGSASGSSVYAEIQTPTTNANGLTTVEIGGGTVVSGVFSTINWSSGTYFIKTETDPTGGTNYSITGTSQLLSVPFALYANNGITTAQTSKLAGIADGAEVNVNADWNATSGDAQILNKPYLSTSKTGDTLFFGKTNFVIVPNISIANPQINTTPLEVADSIVIQKNYSLVTCNDNYLFLKNSTNDSIFVLDINTKKVILSKAFAVNPYCLIKGNVFINPISEYSFSAYNITDIQNWSLIQTFTGLDKGILYWQFYSSLYDDGYYYWIGHWDQSVQIFEITSDSVIQHTKFNVGVSSQNISRLGNDLYVASNYSKNKKFDITNLNSPINRGDFGNSNSNYTGTIDAGYILQNFLSEWGGGGINNLKLYGPNNNILATITNTSGIYFHTFANGYCMVNEGGSINIYDIKNGSFTYIRKLTYETPHYNHKYIVAMPLKTIYLINRP